MKIILKACENQYLFVENNNKQFVIYGEDTIVINEKVEEGNTIKIYSKHTETKDIIKTLCCLPLYIIGALFNILTMNIENRWIDKFEPFSIMVKDYVLENEDDCIINIDYMESKIDKNNNIVYPKLQINNMNIELTLYNNILHLKKCFIEWFIRLNCIFLWGEILLVWGMITSKKYWWVMLSIIIFIIAMITYTGYKEWKYYNQIKQKCLHFF